MTPIERSLSLYQAAAILIEVEASLDKTGDECPSCQRIHYTKWDEYLQAKDLRSMIDKLRKMALVAVPKFQPEPPPPPVRRNTLVTLKGKPVPTSSAT